MLAAGYAESHAGNLDMKFGAVLKLDDGYGILSSTLNRSMMWSFMV